jgi:hypothetical protein
MPATPLKRNRGNWINATIEAVEDNVSLPWTAGGPTSAGSGAFTDPAADGFVVTVAGNVKFDVLQKDGTTTSTGTIAALAGVLYPYRVSKIYSAGTTATGIQVVYY